MEVEKIMVKDVLVVGPETPISMVVKILAIRKITGVPVVDENKKLLGVISEKDVMHLLLASGSDLLTMKAEDFMTKDVAIFEPDVDVNEICKFLMDKPFRRVPIVSDGCLKGIVSRADIIKLLWKEKFEEH
ncbi:MAG: CBS domain-containing protein [Candidatus Omnitrophica bacterium]|nr:CBS domain-containing protein [Candidatus Omnitrophota bacterium]